MGIPTNRNNIEWTEEEDVQLREAAPTYEESNWQMEQSLHPSQQREGRWTSNEDECLKVAVMHFGLKTWKKIAEFVPGRTGVQCRERWVNCLDPCLNMNNWTEEEDSKLNAAIAEHGYCWSKVAACVPPHTNNQCQRRWKLLLPHEVPLLQEARKIEKVSFISNFVDRESKCPTINPDDLLPYKFHTRFLNHLTMDFKRHVRKYQDGCQNRGNHRFHLRRYRLCFGSTIPRRARSKWSKRRLTNDCQNENVPNDNGTTKRRQHKTKDSNQLMRSTGEGANSWANVTMKRTFCEPRTGYSVIAGIVEVMRMRKAPKSHLWNKNTLAVESIDDTISPSDLARLSTISSRQSRGTRSPATSGTSTIVTLNSVELENDPPDSDKLMMIRDNKVGTSSADVIEVTGGVTLSGFLNRQNRRARISEKTALPPQDL
ncbi:SANT/Myb domain [Dillenia turbinata]|uniref:SANT/Myb domain n=1 Tax=Dillenia turbinata TaxID=194707 RepID=A0AAN8Z5A8_9MAGN